jgi:RimJ/RimL family protein N-acetyltransferase
MDLYAAAGLFPDVTADDIFRLETKRLWLRWPRASDAGHLTSFACLAVTAQMTAAIPHPYPAGEAERFIFRARADNADGKSLVLAIAPKRAPHQAIGVISATRSDRTDVELGYILAPHASGKGLATEAATALVDAVFTLTPATAVVANTRVINAASRRVLEKCGFAYVGTGLDVLPARGGLHPCDRFRLTRDTWSKGHCRGSMPPMRHQPLDPFDTPAFAAWLEC